MKYQPYVSIDIETTGLDPDTCQVLEVGAVYETWDRPVEELETFQCLVRHKAIQGEPYALSMHQDILKQIAAGNSSTSYIVDHDELANEFNTWLRGCRIKPQGFTIAGKNVGSFDIQFLKRLPDWDNYCKPVYRYLDPGMLYWNPRVDLSVPSMRTCMSRAGILIENDKVHRAIYDAQLVIKLIRAHQEVTF